MDKHELRISLTFNDDSQTVAWFIEHAIGAERWELWSEGISTPSNGALDAFESCRRWFEQTMGGG